MSSTTIDRESLAPAHDVGAPPKPTFFGSIIAVARLSALRTLRSRKLIVALVASLVIILFPAVIALLAPEGADPSKIVEGGIDWGFYRLLVFLLPVLFTSGAIGEEVEGRTLHFLTMRPASRASIALGKYAVATGASLAVLWAALILLHVVGYASHPSSIIDQLGDTARAGGAASLLVMAYSGICLFWGALVPEGAGMLSVIWLGFVELFISHMPGVVRMLSLNHFGRELAGLERGGFYAEMVPDVELWICAVVVVVGWLVFTGLGVLCVQLSELRSGKA